MEDFAGLTMVSFAMASNLGLRFFHRQVLLDNGELLNRRDRDPGMTAVRFFESEPFDQKAVAGVTGTQSFEMTMLGSSCV